MVVQSVFLCSEEFNTGGILASATLCVLAAGHLLPAFLPSFRRASPPGGPSALDGPVHKRNYPAPFPFGRLPFRYPLLIIMYSRTTSTGLNGLIEKMRSADADFRFMALNDLMTDTRRESFVQMDPEQESTLVKQVLELLKDTNGEVKNMAVKW